MQELEMRLKEYLNVKNLLFCNNGTVVLQMALKALQITGEVITTPFSYVATTTAILWEGCKPVFVDIDPNTFCIDATKIEAAITPDTQAILATHVYGYPCDVEAIEIIAKKYGLKVIYDGAHAFGSKVNGRSLLDYGDISTCSFHATKVFHTGEGGCIICHDQELRNKLMLYRQFGHVGDDYYSMGINGKNSEFHAAMGLCNINYISSILESRKLQWTFYESALENTSIQTLSLGEAFEYNYSYFPIVLQSTGQLQLVQGTLLSKEISCRRYFYPSLNNLPYINHQSCPISESIAERVLCLPLFFDLKVEQQKFIADQIKSIIA